MGPQCFDVGIHARSLFIRSNARPSYPQNTGMRKSIIVDTTKGRARGSALSVVAGFTVNRCLRQWSCYIVPPWDTFYFCGNLYCRGTVGSISNQAGSPSSGTLLVQQPRSGANERGAWNPCWCEIPVFWFADAPILQPSSSHLRARMDLFGGPSLSYGRSTYIKHTRHDWKHFSPAKKMRGPWFPWRKLPYTVLTVT